MTIALCIGSLKSYDPAGSCLEYLGALYSVQQCSRLWIGIFIALAISPLAGCEINRAKRVTHSRPSFFLPRPTIIIFGVDSSRFSEIPRPPIPPTGKMEVELIHMDGGSDGCGVFYDRLIAVQPAEVSGTTYYAFSAPPGAYGLSAGYNAEPYPNNFIAPPGKVVYLGTYLGDEGGRYRLIKNLDGAREWSRSRFDAQPIQAPVSPDKRVPAPPYCVP